MRVAYSCFQRCAFKIILLGYVLVVLVASLLAGLLHACLLTRSYPTLVKHIVSIYCTMYLLKKECTNFNAQHPVAFKQAKPCIIYKETRRLRRSAMAKRHSKKAVYPYQTLPHKTSLRKMTPLHPHHKLSENPPVWSQKRSTLIPSGSPCFPPRSPTLEILSESSAADSRLTLVCSSKNFT